MAFFCIHCKSEIDPKFKACPYCGEAITDFLRRHLETPIDGKYQILARLGVGGMGEVYKVLHIHLNSIRVIKLMRANIASDPGAHERFLREARLATKINHPNVATLFDFSTLDDGSFYMVWEYIEGTNLHELIEQRGPLSPRYAAKLAAQALHGLDAIHRAGIIHRDISPENLMIARDDEGEERVKIIDLGIAKSSSADDNKTKTGMFVGKWKYCSPEHLGMLAAGECIDGRADLYSFGIVMYEMLTGVPPFQADTPHAYLMMHASQRPKPLLESNPGVAAPAELEAVIFRALEKERAKRYATAREFAQVLERLAPELSDATGAPPPLPANAEVTNEATRVVARQRADDVATVVSVAEGAPTIASELVLPEEPPKSRRSAFLAIAAVLLLGLVGAGSMFVKKTPQIATPAATTPAPAPVKASVIAPLPPGRLGINAFPWANVTSIRNLDNGQSVDIGSGLVTPAPVDLAPGRYEVTLMNPEFAKPITRTVSIGAGAEETLNVQFADPARIAVPDFGVAR
ncbi:MAG TPA: serine/threonine-protein kinase [Thermoanaerobaculia bacterium]|nr:serine/threonine-protein kinase [Thermoanaerobaculia bacterium]